MFMLSALEEDIARKIMSKLKNSQNPANNPKDIVSNSLICFRPLKNAYSTPKYKIF